MTATEKTAIRAYRVNLPDERSVTLGRGDTHFYVAFQNGENEMKFRVTPEAMKALATIYNDRFSGRKSMNIAM